MPQQRDLLHMPLAKSFMTVEAAGATVSAMIAAGVVPAALEMMDAAITRAVEDASNTDGPNGRLGVLAITHYNRLLEELLPDRVHILVKGRIVASGGRELADQLERDGYEAFTEASLGQ